MFKSSLCFPLPSVFFRRNPVLALLAGWDVVAWDVAFRQSLFVNIITYVVVTWDVVGDWGAVDVFDWDLVVSFVAAGDQLSHPGLQAHHPPCPTLPCNKTCHRFISSKFYDKSKTPHFQPPCLCYFLMLYMFYVYYLYWGHLFHCEVSRCLDFLGWVVERGFVGTFGPDKKRKVFLKCDLSCECLHGIIS